MASRCQMYALQLNLGLRTLYPAEYRSHGRRLRSYHWIFLGTFRRLQDLGLVNERTVALDGSRVALYRDRTSREWGSKLRACLLKCRSEQSLATLSSICLPCE